MIAIGAGGAMHAMNAGICTLGTEKFKPLK
jgi:hypothetical protein